MSKNKDTVTKKTDNAPQQEEMKLDDARRVKVLSPGMLVFKRFIRNKLAVAGLIILAVMFAYSFIGPLFSPYARQQMFFKEVDEPGDYATGKINTTDPRYVPDLTADPKNNNLIRGILKALGSTKVDGKYVLTAGQEINFTGGKEHYTLRVLDPNEDTPSCAVYGTTCIATYRDGVFSGVDETIVDSGMLSFITADAEAGGKETELDYNGKTITVEISKIERKYFTTSPDPIAVSTYNIYSPLLGKIADLQSDTEFMHNVNIAIHNGETAVNYDGADYVIEGNAEEGYLLSKADGTPLFNVTRDFRYAKVEPEADPDAEPTKEPANPEEVDNRVYFNETVEDIAAFEAAVNAALKEGETSFTFEEKDYSIETTETEYHVTNANGEMVVALVNSFDPVESKYDVLNTNYNFVIAAEEAIVATAKSFEFEDETYQIMYNDADYTVQNAAGDDVVLISNIAYGPAMNGIELTVDFILKLQKAIRGKEMSFSFVDQYGEEIPATMTVVNGNYYVSVLRKTSLLDARAPISGEHWLGTENNGMDVFTRLMYGGRVSLIVGFVVVFFEISIGVVVGGISGYFGGVVDTLLMRFVELFNAIPFYPMLIILGSVMDELHTDATTRLFMTMVILGILGWTGIARIVRGQILSLREQDFMIATEATGIRTSRRIFRHLIPNVMPLLIVNATAGLGGIILTEATLGFLGLGVKYPMASWGSIINQVNDMQVMKTAWWIWIPAGLLILLTVLGFNFVGDGLRDAFDPKMKR